MTEQAERVQRTPGTWLPIETAPKDGAAFWGRCDRDAITMFWHPKFNAFISSFHRMTVAPGYTFEDGSTFSDHSPEIRKPDAWMPLPPPPEAARSQLDAESK